MIPMMFPLTLLIVAVCLAPAAATGVNTAQVFWVDHGKKTEIPPSAVCQAQVVDAALALVGSANEKWKRVIGDADREAIFRDESAFHIRFSSPRTVVNAAFGRTLLVTEILIPLSGSWSVGRTVILYADPTFRETNQMLVLGENSHRVVLDKCLAGLKQ